MPTYQYYVLYKPYGYLSQFSKEHPEHKTLADLCGGIAKDVFPLGRLDKDSEGLLLLTSDRTLNHRLLHPSNKHRRSYLVQVEGIPDAQSLQKLQSGVEISIHKKPYKSLPCKVSLLDAVPDIPPREPPVRFRKTVADRWLRITMVEGKNRQVRKMCAAVGHPVLRLVRERIEGIRLGEMHPGDLLKVDRADFYRCLFGRAI